MPFKTKKVVHVFVDPGKNTGLAVFSSKGRLLAKHIIKTDKTEFEAVCAMRDNFDIMMNEIKSQYIVKSVTIESVALWSGSEKSVIATSTGKNFLLAYIIGSYVSICLDFMHQKTIHLITPQKWKGNMSKEICRRRLEDALGVEHVPKNEHVRDAVAMGLDNWDLL